MMSEENESRKWNIRNLAGLLIRLVNNGYCHSFTRGVRNGENITMEDSEFSFFDAFEYSDDSLVRIGNYPFDINVCAAECKDIWRKINYSIVFLYEANKVCECANKTSVNDSNKEIVDGSKLIEFTVDCSELTGKEEINAAHIAVVNDIMRLLKNDTSGVFENIEGVNLVSVKEFEF